MIDLEQVTADYERDGVVRIPQLISEQQAAEFRAEIERYVRDDLSSKPLDARTLEPDGLTVRNLWRLEQHNEMFREFGNSKQLLPLISLLVQGEPELLAVETFSKPARVGSGVPPHQDNAYFCQSPPDVCTVWIALDAVTPDNGPVRFHLGSHKLGMLPTRPSGVKGNSVGLAEPLAGENVLSPTLQPGDATIHHCQTVHASSPNTTDDSRLALLLVYRGTHTETDPSLQSAYTAAVTANPPA